MESENTEVIQNGRINGKFAPGVSGNPAGKPKGAKHMSTLLQEAIKKVAEGYAEPADVLIIKTLIAKAINGNDKSISEIWDRLEGKAAQAIDLSGEITKKIVSVDE